MDWTLVIWSVYLTSTPQLKLSMPMATEANCERYRAQYEEILKSQSEADPRFRFEITCKGVEKVPPAQPIRLPPVNGQ